MNYSPKLKNAMQEIKDVMERHDIAGIVVLHSPGAAEYYARLDPGYSCVKYTPEGNLKIRAKLEDFNGDVKARTKKIADTSNMFRMLTDTMVQVTYPIHEIADHIDKVVQAEHEDGGHSSHTTQNN